MYWIKLKRKWEPSFAVGRFSLCTLSLMVTVLSDPYKAVITVGKTECWDYTYYILLLVYWTDHLTQQEVNVYVIRVGLQYANATQKKGFHQEKVDSKDDYRWKVKMWRVSWDSPSVETEKHLAFVLNRCICFNSGASNSFPF